MNLSEKDRQDLTYAVDVLENPSFTAQLTNLIGRPIEKVFERLPQKWSGKIVQITQIALRKALKLSIKSMDLSYTGPPKKLYHKLLCGSSGAIGGAFGLVALTVELLASTGIMLRSIADIARSEGEELNNIPSQLACLEVFALGGKSKDDDGTETGYFAVRASLAQPISEAAKFIAEKGLTEEGAPILIRFITKIATRFGVQVSEKAAAQAIPIIGAVTGASINILFISHFQNMARGHFTVRRLEREYDADFIKTEYEKIKRTFVN